MNIKAIIFDFQGTLFESISQLNTGAIELMQYHTEDLWQQFGSFLLAQTVLLGFIGSSLANNVNKNWVLFGGSFIGLLLCFPWYSTFNHNYQYYLLRIKQARHQEEKLGISLLSEGRMYS